MNEFLSKCMYIWVEKYSWQYCLQTIFICDFISFMRHIYCMDPNIHFIHCSPKSFVHVQFNILSIIHPVFHSHAIRIELGSLNFRHKILKRLPGVDPLFWKGFHIYKVVRDFRLQILSPYLHFPKYSMKLQ